MHALSKGTTTPPLHSYKGRACHEPVAWHKSDLRCAHAADRMVRNDDPASPADLLRVFMWNITNLAAVRAGAKPVLDEVGPFVYRKWRIKEVCTWCITR